MHTSKCLALQGFNDTTDWRSLCLRFCLLALLIALSVSGICKGFSYPVKSLGCVGSKNRISIGYSAYYIPTYQFASFQRVWTPTYIGYRRKLSSKTFVVAEYSRILLEQDFSNLQNTFDLVILEYIHPRIGIGRNLISFKQNGMLSFFAKLGYRAGDEVQVERLMLWNLSNGQKVYELKGKRLFLNDLSLHAALEYEYPIFRRWSLGLNMEYQYFIKLKDKNEGNTFNGTFRYSNMNLSSQFCLGFHF